jgi:hypothetical protein
MKRLLRRAFSVNPSGWALFGGDDAWFLRLRERCVATDFLFRLRIGLLFPSLRHHLRSDQNRAGSWPDGGGEGGHSQGLDRAQPQREHRPGSRTATLSMTIWATAAFGQQLGQEIINEQQLLNVTKGGTGSSAVQWEPIRRDASAEEVKTQLERAGWDTGAILKNLEGGTTFDVYQRALEPGQVGFMTFPKSGSSAAEPATFLPFSRSRNGSSSSRRGASPTPNELSFVAVFGWEKRHADGT